jgi:uncharacterized protein (DUF1800 family)
MCGKACVVANGVAGCTNSICTVASCSGGFLDCDNSALDGRLNGLGLDLTRRSDIGRWWVTRMIHTARPLEEKMTLFWHGLLTSAISKIGRPEPMVAQNEFFRANAVARFPDILKGVSMDPAMMLWLDTATNRKGHPNENYARELMELHTLGVSGGPSGSRYTQQDVQELARVLTGAGLNLTDNTPRLSADQKALYVRRGLFEFNPARHDMAPKSVLGHTIAGRGLAEIEDVVTMLCRQPATARYISTKLATYFVADDPPKALVEKMTRTFM